MAEDSRPLRNPAGRAGLLNNLLALLGALAGFFESRAALIAIESRAALVQLLIFAACIGAAVLLFAFGYVFVLVSAIVAIAHAAKISWIWIALGVGGVHFILALIFILVGRNYITRPMFRASATELKKDSEWLRTLGNHSNR